MDVTGDEDFDPARLLGDLHEETGRVAGFVAFMRRADLYERLPYVFDTNGS